MTIITDLRLRPLEIGDVDFLLRWQGDPEITDTSLGRRFPLTRDATLRWIDESNQGRFPDRIVWIIAGDELLSIGVAQLEDVNWISRTAWFGIWIFPNAWNKNYGTSATRLMIDYAKMKLNLRQLRLKVRSDHERAMSIYRRLGFVEEGIMLAAEIINESPKDVAIMRLDL